MVGAGRGPAGAIVAAASVSLTRDATTAPDTIVIAATTKARWYPPRPGGTGLVTASTTEHR